MAAGRQVNIPLASKTPFANYDLVVYLGGGFFSLLIFWRYVAGPFNIFDFTQLSASKNAPWTEQLIFVTLLAVISYTAGHLSSYLSSYFVEGFINRTLGKFSDVAKLSTKPFDQFCHEMRQKITDGRAENFCWDSLFRIPFTQIQVKLRKRNFLIWLFHLPMMWWYCFVSWKGYFRFADTRLPSRMFKHLNIKLKHFFGNVDTKKNKQWFRWVEYYTSYNAPVAAASMYNYLVISGFMRLLAFLFLLAIWFELIHAVVEVCGIWLPALKVEAITHGPGGWLGHGLYALALLIGYICALTSYFKFYRRYVEEAVMGFLLEVPADPTKPV